MKIKQNEITCDDNGIANKRNKFCERWNIKDDIEDKNITKTRCLLVICKMFNDIKDDSFYNMHSINDNTLDNYCLEISSILGISCKSDSFSNFEQKELYKYLINLDLNNQTDYCTFIWYLELTLNYEHIYEEHKKKLINKIVEVLKLSGCNVRIIKNKDGYEIYPNELDFLDEPLKYDILNWLEEYKNVKKHFSQALKTIRIEKNSRYIVDELRLSLELLLKTLFNNEKSLENQKNNIGIYLKENNISTEIANMFVKLMDLYTLYNNENAKHNDNINEYEIDYLIYLTGNFMRFIMLIEQSKNEEKGE